MTEFAYLDESLDINQTQSYHLSIQLGLNGLSFCILDTVTNKYIALRHYPVSGDAEQKHDAGVLKKIIEKDDILLKPFKSSAVMIGTFKSTLVPSGLFRKNDAEHYFSFSHTLDKDEVVLSDKLGGPDAWCLYAVNKDYSGLFGELFPDILIFHHATPFIEGIFRNTTGRDKEAAMHILVHDTFFDIAVTVKQKLVLFNTYMYRQVNDIVYFILYICKMLQLDQQSVPIILEGKVNVQSSLPETLKKYIRHVSFAGRNPSYTYSYKLNSLEAHTFANLFNLHPCV